MGFKYKSQDKDDADLDITSFMNLMIVLVPVLLLSMTFTQITVLDIELPELTGGFSKSEENQSQLEVRVTDKGYKIFYPSNKMLYEIPMIMSSSSDENVKQPLGYDYPKLSLVMREVKQQLKDKKDVVLLSAPDVDYQNLVFTMETLKSYKTTIAASVVEVELFPEISLGDAK